MKEWLNKNRNYYSTLIIIHNNYIPIIIYVIKYSTSYKILYYFKIFNVPFLYQS